MLLAFQLGTGVADLKRMQMSSLQQGRPEAAAAIWDWRTPTVKPTRESSAASLRTAGIIQASVTATFGALVYYFWSSTIATVIFSIAGIVLFCAVASPTGLYRGVQAFFNALGNATGRVLTWLMLVPLFYLFFFPFGLLLRRGRRDQLKRYYETDKESYWEIREGPGVSDHERQF
jgi:hypothetical protein